MSDGPRMLVSLGVQKAATTWLAHYMALHPDCVRTPLKEVHYFDYYDLGGLEDLGLARLRRRREQLIERGAAQPSLRHRPFYLRTLTFLDARIAAIEAGEPTPEGYEQLVLSTATSQSRIVGEMTPANGLLSTDRLRAIADLPSAPLFVFVLRDPVDRAWSEIRMDASRETRKGDFAAAAEEMITQFLAGGYENIRQRSDYADMIARIDAAVPTDRLFVDFFEDFLSQDRIDALCDFLGVRRHDADFDRQLLPGQSLKLDADQRVALARHLKPQYDAVEQRMGRLPARWTQNRALAA